MAFLPSSSKWLTLTISTCSSQTLGTSRLHVSKRIAAVNLFFRQPRTSPCGIGSAHMRRGSGRIGEEGPQEVRKLDTHRSCREEAARSRSWPGATPTSQRFVVLVAGISFVLVCFFSQLEQRPSRTLLRTPSSISSSSLTPTVCSTLHSACTTSR